MEFLSVCSPDYVIYTGRFSAPVRRYSMHGQQLGRAGVSQDPLQGLRPAVLSCLCCLGNTHLQPPNRLPDAGPINGFPRQRRWGERRISPECFRSRHLLSFSLDGSASSLARIDQTDVGLSSALPLALAFSVIPRLRPLTRLAVRSARSPNRTGWAAFPCSANFTG